jgi:hypothetical protein
MMRSSYKIIGLLVMSVYVDVDWIRQIIQPLLLIVLILDISEKPGLFFDIWHKCMHIRLTSRARHEEAERQFQPARNFHAPSHEE